MKKLLEYEFAIEAILIGIIAICLLALLIKIVIPNFSVKSLAVSWMTMLGAVVIFAYTIFIEMKDESFKSSFKTYSSATSNFERIQIVIPSERHAPLSLRRYQEENSIEYLNNAKNLISIGTELILINAISYISSDYKDWRFEKYTSPTSSTRNYRSMEDANGDTLLIEGIELSKPTFKHFKLTPLPANDFIGYSILPRGSRLSISGKKLLLSNPHFSFEIEPFSLNRIYGIEKQSPQPVQATDFEVIVSYRLLKSKSGHWRREEYRNFCQKLAEGIKERLEVPDDRWPKEKAWG